MAAPRDQTEPLAHSAHDGAPTQTYRDHVAEVCRLANLFAREAATFSPKHQAAFLAAIEAAAIYHDLGKLDEIFQEILRHNRKNQAGFNHCDAGTAHLLKLRLMEAALLCYSHHIGLPCFSKEKAKNVNGQNLTLRDTGPLILKRTGAWEWTETQLAGYLERHHAIFPQTQPPKNRPLRNVARRLALSCLVDGDHSDTAQHYGNEKLFAGLPLKATERLAALDNYVEKLRPAKEPTDQRELDRLRLRQDIYRACRERTLKESERIVSCDSPVGTGKTTAVMAHLLRTAAERKLRRIFVVLPFTNIIDQSVDVYRRALVLPGENPESVVAAHHHKVEFSGENWSELRLLTQRWEAPIVVTTAVQFFETLAAKDTSPLRKFHQVPGAAIFVDETHAAMPAPLWPQMWRWLNELCDDWNCHLVLASGSLAQFWTLDEFVPTEEQRTVPRLVPVDLARPAFDYERNRVRIGTLPNRVSLSDLADAVLSAPGPRLVIFNTIQSAASFARYLRINREQGFNVEHISTALCPADRAITLARVRQNLGSNHKNWVLVATSCVEAGVDFSFRTGFRERSCFTSLLQILGRVSRGGEYVDSVVWDFEHDESGALNIHPQFKISRKIVAQLFEKYGHNLSPDHCTEALQAELNQGTGETEIRADKILETEKASDFPEVAKLCRLITADTQTIVVCPKLIARFKTHDSKQFPTSRELMNQSIQVWRTKLKELPLTEPLGFGEDLLGLQEGCYDSFLGYMHGYLPILDSRSTGLHF